MSVSVVMPVRNGMPHLPDALAAIAAQTHAPLEVIVVDGGSTDGSREACRGVRVIEAAGVTQAEQLNLGVAAARGDLIAFAADDDLVAPAKLERQVAALAAGADACVCLVEAFLDGPAPAGFRHELLEAPRVMRVPEALMVRRSAWDRVGEFRAETSPAMDLDWFARAGECGLDIVVADGGVLLRKRFHAHTMTAGPTMTPAILRSLRDAIQRRRTA
jgi:glycosyltransferase involved in cell wall biosynthesis